jgi:formate/nitrite transporter
MLMRKEMRRNRDKKWAGRSKRMHSPLEIAQNYIEVGINKANMSIFKMILLGFFAGMFIGFAGIASTVASSTIPLLSVAKLVGATVFPAGMAMVLIAGSELFTGNNLIIIAVLEKKVSIWKMLKNWLFVYIGNFLGASFVATLVVYGNTPSLFGGQLAEAIVNAGKSRTDLAFSESFIRGILCNILVCIAVWMSFAAKRVSGKLLTSFWPVMLFVLCGFEHSVADMYFGVAALLTKAHYGIAAESLTIVNFILKNLIPVTAGNIIGGAGIVGCGYWLAYLHRTPYSHVQNSVEQKELDIAEEY